MEYSHKPVLLNEVLTAFEYLKDIKCPVFVDGTVGLAGHSTKLAEEFRIENKEWRIIAIDKDSAALTVAKKRLTENPEGAPLGRIVENFIFVNDQFENIKEILADLKIEKVDGMLLDLGVSSMQLDDADRGFSFQTDAPLDMRMDQGQDLTAKVIIDKYSEKDLVSIFSEYGEERFSKTIARKIIEQRTEKAIETTKELSDIVISAVPAKYRSSKTSPATNVFRALRMEVNREVADLEQGVTDAVSVLSKGGKLAVISFHSIEDRIVKQAMNKLANPCTCSPKQPVCVCGLIPQIKILTKKPIVASEEEVEANPRARSAKLRIAERI